MEMSATQQKKMGWDERHKRHTEHGDGAASDARSTRLRASYLKKTVSVTCVGKMGV